MFRDILIAGLMIATSTAAFAADGASVLTGKTLIQGDRVTVGDLFTNAGHDADHVLAPAPDVGKTLILGKSDLQRVAKAFHLDWQAPENDVSVSLERDAVGVNADDVIAALSKSDLEEKISKDASFSLNGFDHPLAFDGQEPVQLDVTNTSFDESSQKFAATLHISRNGQLVKDLQVDGTAKAMAHVPVLIAPAGIGNVITAENVKEIAVPKDELRPNAILSKADLIGMTPKRTLMANQAISSNDVIQPLMIKRNDLVTVVYKNGPILLSTKARALSDGARGEAVNLLNANSKKPFSAIITGPQQAEVNVAINS